MHAPRILLIWGARRTRTSKDLAGMNEPVMNQTGIIETAWHDFGVPAITSGIGMAFIWFLQFRKRRKQKKLDESKRQELRDQALCLSVETMWGILSVIQSFPCIVGECGPGQSVQRLSEQDRTDLAILRHDISTMRLKMSEAFGRLPVVVEPAAVEENQEG